MAGAWSNVRDLGPFRESIGQWPGSWAMCRLAGLPEQDSGHWAMSTLLELAGASWAMSSSLGNEHVSGRFLGNVPVMEQCAALWAFLGGIWAFGRFGSLGPDAVQGTRTFCADVLGGCAATGIRRKGRCRALVQANLPG